jgi:ankyrin repeat protein
MSACNKYSESVVHMACRRGSFEVADFILSNGGDCNIIDDYGRTPLHDACWRMDPRFDVVTLLLDRNLDLLRTLDVRGSTPLKYVREEHWIQWCAYIFHQKEKYWRPIGDPTENNKRLRCF